MRPPDYQGANGSKAWIVPPPSPLSRRDWSATCSQWLVHQPGVHIAWYYWVLTVIHLRPIEGVRDPKLQFPGASHEFLAYAQNPDFDPDPDNPETFHFLTPMDLVHQVGGLTDDQASELGNLMVKHVMEGEHSLDSDFRRYWENTIDTTSACMISGKHKASLN